MLPEEEPVSALLAFIIRYIRNVPACLRVVAVEPCDSAVLSGGEPEVPLPDFEDAYQTQRVLEAALLSAEQRRVRANIRLLAKVRGNKRLKARLLKSLGKLEERLSKATARYVKADEELPYGFVIKVLAVLDKVGVEQVGMVTLPEDR